MKQSCSIHIGDSAGRELGSPDQAVVRKGGIWQDSWWGACWLLRRAGLEITCRREGKEVRNDCL